MRTLKTGHTASGILALASNYQPNDPIRLSALWHPFEENHYVVFQFNNSHDCAGKSLRPGRRPTDTGG